MRSVKSGVVVAMVMWFGGCIAEAPRLEGDPADLQVGQEPSLLSAVFSGTVTDARGVPQAGVTVTINGITRVTDSTGRYFMSVASVTTGYKISFTKSGFAPSSAFYAAGETNLQHALTSGSVTTVNPALDSTVSGPGGVTVSLPANSLMTPSGTPPVGMVRVTVAAYEPLQMPGDFTAVNAAGEQVALESVGAVFVGATDDAGQTLDLRAGMTADAFIPTPREVGPMPACVFDGSCRVAMWKFDPNSGLWVEARGAGLEFTAQGTRFRMSNSNRFSPVIPISSGGLGMWNADIEKKTPACTIIELVNIPGECFGAAGRVSLSLKLPNAAGALISRTDTMSSATPYIVLYNIRASVVQEVRVTFPSDAPSARCGSAMTIQSSPSPVAGFPVVVSTGGVTRFNAGAPWGGTGFPVDSGGSMIDFIDVATDMHPCKSHVWFQL